MHKYAHDQALAYETSILPDLLKEERKADYFEGSFGRSRSRTENVYSYLDRLDAYIAKNVAATDNPCRIKSLRSLRRNPVTRLIRRK